MIIELVSTGTELLLGEIVNTNAPYLAKRLNELGFNVLFQTTVGDNRDRMAQVLQVAMSRADIIITSGGLGPTQGDITKEITAQVSGRLMFLDDSSVQRIQCMFAKRHSNMPQSNLRQAMMPEGAIVVPNDRGTAPGVILETPAAIFINLPGPPHEMEGMFEQAIVPYLQNRFGVQGVIVSKILRTYGIGESSLEEEIKDYILAQSNPTIALLVRNGEIIVRITASAAEEATAQTMISNLEEKIRARIGNYVFGTGADTLELVTGRMLVAKDLSIALAESCTGGLVTTRLTDIAGSSAYLKGSIICYSNEIKVSLVDVPETILAAHGAVSSQTAECMASGVRKKFATAIGMGITGIAGPTGATPHKPIGLVYIAIDGPLGTRCSQYHFSGERIRIKRLASQAALEQLRRYIMLM